jgi:hypothetical protein
VKVTVTASRGNPLAWPISLLCLIVPPWILIFFWYIGGDRFEPEQNEFQKTVEL